jgi:hypothetical protein
LALASFNCGGAFWVREAPSSVTAIGAQNLIDGLFPYVQGTINSLFVAQHYGILISMVSIHWQGTGRSS